MSKDGLPVDLAPIVLAFYVGLATPLSLDLAEKLRKGDWDGILAVKPDPRTYSHSTAYLRDAAAAGLLKKFSKLPSSHDKLHAAQAKWIAGEHDCYRTNLRLTPYLGGPYQAAPAGGITEFIQVVRKIIRGWIGSRPPPLSSLRGRFGPGSTYGDKGDRATIPDKMSSQPTLTPLASALVPTWVETQWGRSVDQQEDCLVFVRGNRFATAPKTALTHRAIAIEPSINVFYQLAYGELLKDLLKRRPTAERPDLAGWDLKRAQEIHRLVAWVSSVSREFATLDLSNASDTVARNLVRLLLPRAWWMALEAVRSPVTEFTKVPGFLQPGQSKTPRVVLEKFSSMGNGFTFELETIIFAALSCAVSREAGHVGRLGEDVFVFGDDIIVKDDVAEPLIPVLRFFGFSLNKEKSFWGDVPFRESCGGDYYSGDAVRPHNLEDELNEPQDFMALANGIRRVYTQLHDAGETESVVAGVRRAWFKCLDRLPVNIRRCRGPEQLGDIVIHDDRGSWKTRTRNSIRYVQAYRPARRKTVGFGYFRPGVVLACATYGTGNVGTPVAGRVPSSIAEPSKVQVPPIEGLIPRDGVLSYKVGWVPYS